MSQQSHHELRAMRRHAYAKADRLKVTAGCTGAAKRSLKIVKKWVSGRVQWGAAIAKLWAREEGWRIVDDMMQNPSECGCKTADSLKAHGENPVAVERLMRVFIARAMLDTHLTVSSAVLASRKPMDERLQTTLKSGLLYAGWYPKQ